MNIRVVYLIDLGSLKMVVENFYGHGRRFIDCCQVNTVLSGHNYCETHLALGQVYICVSLCQVH